MIAKISNSVGVKPELVAQVYTSLQPEYTDIFLIDGTHLRVDNSVSEVIDILNNHKESNK